MNSDEDDFIKWWQALLTAGDDRGHARPIPPVVAAQRCG